MNAIGGAIERGEIECAVVTWEVFNDVYVPPCAYCESARKDETGHMVCLLFDDRYDSIEPEPASPMSSASLLSVIVRCSLKKVVTT